MSKTAAPHDPVGFLSYVHDDDKHERGRLTQLREDLSGEVRAQTGEKFEIFQDAPGIAWGQQWKRRVDDSLDAVTFLIPIITPGFFKSAQCRRELERFLDRESELGRDDLILPIYYINCPALNDEAQRKQDPLAEVVAARQYADWRELRFEPLTDPQVRRRLASLAGQIVEALRRGEPARVGARAISTAAAAAGQSEPADAVAELGPETVEAQSPKSALGPSDKPEPPTIVVDAMHRGHHSTLTAALEAAKPGDRVLVRPGTYREGVVIDKPVEIIGDGEVDDIVIEATGRNTILFKASMGRIANLTLRQAGGGSWFCVNIAQGRLDMEGCNISSKSLSCVAVHSGADPRVRRNHIHDGNESGVFVYDEGQGTFEDNEIFGNTLGGVSVKTSGNPTVRRNRIRDGKGSGVTVYENGQGTFEDNEIFGNTLAGMAVRTGGNPTVRRNRIHDGKQGGVMIYENGLGIFEDNEICGNGFAGVEIREGGDPTLRGNRIYDSKQGGVMVYETGQGVLEDNDIFANAYAGIEIKEGGNPTVRRNRIHDGKQGGVIVHSDGKGILEDNDILANDRAGIATWDGGDPTVRSNRISKNRYQAIRVLEKGRGTFDGNDLRDNTKGAWDIAADCIDHIVRKDNQE
jgi:parallel beta-helix repeat protein